MSDDPLYGKDFVSRAMRAYDRLSYFNYEERFVLICLLLCTIIPAFILSNVLLGFHAPDSLA